MDLPEEILIGLPKRKLRKLFLLVDDLSTEVPWHNLSFWVKYLQRKGYWLTDQPESWLKKWDRNSDSLIKKLKQFVLNGKEVFNVPSGYLKYLGVREAIHEMRQTDDDRFRSIANFMSDQFSMLMEDFWIEDSIRRSLATQRTILKKRKNKEKLHHRFRGIEIDTFEGGSFDQLRNYFEENINRIESDDDYFFGHALPEDEDFREIFFSAFELIPYLFEEGDILEFDGERCYLISVRDAQLYFELITK